MPTPLNFPVKAAKRRSVRIALNTPVGLSGYDRQQCAFTMSATATSLNRHGAAIHLPRELSVGSTVIVRNARGTQVSARVVAQLATSKTVSVYAIEFVQQNDSREQFLGNHISNCLKPSRNCGAGRDGTAQAEPFASSFQCGGLQRQATTARRISDIGKRKSFNQAQ